MKKAPTEEPKKEFPKTLYVVRAISSSTLLTSLDRDDLPVIIDKGGTQVATYVLQEVGIIRERVTYEKTDNSCPHGHLDWDDCPDCCH